VFAAMMVSALTLFAVAVNGYHPYAEDGGLYMAGVKRLLDPAIYPHGTAFVLEPTRFSLFAPAVAGMARATGMGLPAMLPALHLASVWATLFAAWMLAARCWTRREARTGAVALLACWLGLPVAGTALMLMDPYVTARSLSTPAMVLALVGALDMTMRGARLRGCALWLGSIALAAAMHPLMAAYALGASLLLLSMRAPGRSVRLRGTAVLCGAALALAALQAAAPAASAEYARVAMTRGYWFIAEWRWYEVGGLLAPLAILAWCMRRVERSGARGCGARGSGRVPRISPLRCGIEPSPAKEEEAARRALARMAVAAGATAAIVALLFARAGAAPLLVARMQPLRVFQIVYLAMTLMLGAKLGERLLRRSAWRWASALALLGAVMFTAARAAYPNSNHLEMPWRPERNLWVRAFVWVRDNTPKQALFALDADYINAPGEDAQCFRAIAERSALADYSKDGGEASIAPGLTAEWMAGQRAQAGLSAGTDSERLRALKPLGVSWMVLEAGAATEFDCPFRNAAVKVCQLP
jgi:hypothetical protein